MIESEMTERKPLRFRDESNMVAYAFAAAEEEDTHEPLTYQDTRKVAMKEEMDSLRKNKTWELVDHPAGQKLVSCKWLFKIKEGIEGVQKPRYKARVVARGFTQRADGIFHGNLKEVIYMRQPPGYEQGTSYDSCVISGRMHQFGHDELGEAKKILGMEIVRDRSRKILRVSQSGYISKILNNFRIDNGKSVQMPLGGHFKLSLKDCPVRDCDVERMSKVPYANVVGSLMYLMVCTRPDIAYAWRLGMGQDRGNMWTKLVFVDSDYARIGDKVRSIMVNAFFSTGMCCKWRHRYKQWCSLTTDAEYMALTKAVNEAIWLKGLLEEESLGSKGVEVLKANAKPKVEIVIIILSISLLFRGFNERADGPFRILKKINDNAYKVELPGHYGVSSTFNVADLSPYTPDADFDDDSGSSRFLEGEDDTDQGGSPLSPTQAEPTESG
ncbi:retrotransposon protein, putative, ty1-copia subclass [Tanacetum coccineum]